MRKYPIFSGQNKLMRPLVYTLGGIFVIYILLNVAATTNSIDRYATSKSAATDVVGRFVDDGPIRISSAEEQVIEFTRPGNYIIFTSTRPEPDYLFLLQSQTTGQAIELTRNRNLPEIALEPDFSTRSSVQRTPMFDFTIDEPGSYLISVAQRDESVVMPSRLFVTIIPNLTTLNTIVQFIIALLTIGLIIVLSNGTYVLANLRRMRANAKTYQANQSKWDVFAGDDDK